ncbi:MAG TPA: serine hydrolase [Ktedonobacterales bacterium]|nr:serine hydrolase [Ktedonobacterales bacterium]
MQAKHPHEIERWISRTIAWPLVFALSLVALFGAVAREAHEGPTLATAHQRTDAAAANALVVSLGAPPGIAARAGYVMDADTGTVFYAHHPDEQRAMASCTKIMTALVTTQQGGLDRSVTVGADAASYVNSDNSYMGLSAGESLTLNQLLYGLLLPSGNDAAIAIADAVGGTQQHFVVMMNAEAQVLGMTHTHFTNPHGLDDPGHYTSARDLATLAAVALRQNTIAAIAASGSYYIAATPAHKAYFLSNYNSLLAGKAAAYPGAVGLKPGNTGAAGWCEAFAARRDGHLIVGVVLDSPTWTQRNDDMHALLDWGFAQVGVPPAG